MRFSQINSDCPSQQSLVIIWFKCDIEMVEIHTWQKRWVKVTWLHLPPEAKLIHGNSKVPGLIVAMVEVAVVHRDQVHIAEDEAVIRGFLQGLPVAHIQKLGSVEGVFTQLWETHKKTPLFGREGGRWCSFIRCYLLQWHHAKSHTVIWDTDHGVWIIHLIEDTKAHSDVQHAPESDDDWCSQWMRQRTFKLGRN